MLPDDSPPLPPPAADAVVVVTGVGILTSLGNGWRVNADGFRDGRVAIRPVSVFDVSRQQVGQAGEVALPADLPPNDLPVAELRRLERGGHLLLHAGHEALVMSGISRADVAGNAAIVLGTSAGAMAHGEEFFRRAVDPGGHRGGQAARAVSYQVSHQAGLLGRAFGLSAPVTVISNACASGANALGHAYHLIRSGRCDVVVAGGYDALCRLVFAGFDALKALSRTIPRPFDVGRDGLALGEGAAIFILESHTHAVARHAPILAELAGYGIASDVHHLTQPHPGGAAAVASMTRACLEAGVHPEQVQYINSHGTGTPLNDPAEAAAIATWAGAAARTIAVSSTKGNIGHLLGGAGAVEAAVCLMAMKEGFLPPTAGLVTPDPCVGFDLVTRPRAADLAVTLTNSFGFGGSNASLVFRRIPS